MQVLAGERVVEVYTHFLSDRDDETGELPSLCILQLYDVAFGYVFAVKLAVDGEHLLVEFDDSALVIFSVCTLNGDSEVKTVAYCKRHDGLFEIFEHHAEAAEESEWFAGACLF